MIKILNSNIYPISEIEFWLLKYSDYYKEIKALCNCGSKTDDLPCICKRSKNENLFLSMYISFEELAEYHRLEKYAREVLINLSKNKNEIKHWLIKNEKTASQDLACFLIDYLDYSENAENNINLLAYRNEKEKIEIFINRQDFENLIEFKEIFDELYYVEKLYPEGLKRIDEEMKTTANKELWQKTTDF